MKRLKCAATILLLFLLTAKADVLHAQFLKQVLNTVKNTAEGRANSKASQSTNNVLDKVDDLGKNKTKKNTADNKTASTSTSDTTHVNNNTQGQSKASSSSNNSNGSSQQNNEYNSDGSFIKLNFSSGKTLAGCAVIISGSSVVFQNLNAVNVTIKGSAASETRKLVLDKNGNFSFLWQAAAAGTYNIIAQSSDGKSHQAKTLEVYNFEDMDLITTPLTTETTKSFDKLKSDIDEVKAKLTSEDAQALQKKMDVFTIKKDQFLKQLNDVATATKGLNDVEKKYSGLPSSVLQNVSRLNDIISTTATGMAKENEVTDHKAYDNSICEYLVMVSEACAAFSTILNFEGTAGKIIINLAADKGGRTVAGYSAGAITGSDAAGKAAGECSSLYIGASVETKALDANFSPLSFGGDIAQMCSDLLLKRYCAVMSGELTHQYECTYRNKNSEVWWDYTYTTGAVISLRYPKDNAGGNIIKMKGNIEGNATKFSIYQNAENIDEYKDAMKNRERFTQFYSVCVHKPVAVPFTAATADKDIGFGAVARAVAVPSAFNIPIDADYDVSQKKITIYVNDALIDFSPLVCYIYGYIVVAAGIPLVTRVNYPIQPVKLTLGKAIKENNDFHVRTGADNNLTVNGKGNTHIGDAGSSIEHHISFSFNLKSE